MGLEEIKLMHKKIQFELLFSRSNSFASDTIEHVARFSEKALGFIGYDVSGVYDEMTRDPEFQFYLNMVICDFAYVPSATNILFLKFVKNYYSKF